MWKWFQRVCNKIATWPKWPTDEDLDELQDFAEDPMARLVREECIRTGKPVIGTRLPDGSIRIEVKG